MAISYRGTAQSLAIYGNDDATQNLFVVENGIASRVNVIVRRLTLGSDSLAVLTSVQNVIKTCRATSVSGGHIVHKAPFVGTQTSDPNVAFRAQTNESGRITATAGDTLWTQLAARMHTVVEQVLPDDHDERLKHRNLLPQLSSSTADFVIRPGEALLARVVAATAASNPYATNNYTVRCSWEEDELSTFAISGTVTLASVPVAGAVVYVMESDDEIGTNSKLVQTITTGVGGTWASTIRTGKVGSAFVQYKAGGTYYTAPGSPYLD
jgi:hypothetical protein